MDQDNRQGSGFDQNTGGAPGQQSFFLNQQQQQQLIQNQLMQKQVTPGAPQISQTPQMMPAQRSMFAMQGSQNLFQQAQLSGQGVGQLPGSAQFAGAPSHDAMRQEIPDGQSVGGASQSQTAQQMKILGFPPGSYGAGGSQDQLLQQRQQPQQQMHQQQQRMGMPGILADSSSFMGQSTGAPGQGNQATNPGQSQIPSQFQQSLLGMSSAGQSHHQSIPQTPQQSAFILPQHLLQTQELGGSHHQSQQATRQQPGTQQSQFHGGNNNQSSGNTAPVGAGAQNSQSQSNAGNSLHTPGQSNMPASLQQQLAQAQGQTTPQGQQSITNQFFNQLLSTQQSQGGAPPQSIFSQMKPNGQWPQSIAAGLPPQAVTQPASQLNQGSNHNQSQNRQNDQSSSFHQMAQPIQKPAQMQQPPQASAAQKSGMDEIDNRGNLQQQMWQMQQQNNRRQPSQQDEHRLQQQFQQPGQNPQSNQAQSNAEAPSQQTQAQSFQGGNQGQSQQLTQSFLDQQQNSQNRQRDNSYHQHFRESVIKQEQKQPAQSPFTQQHGQLQSSQAQQQQQLFSGNPEHSHPIEQATQHHQQQLHGAAQAQQQQFYQGGQSAKPGNETKPAESQQQQFYQGGAYGANQQQDGGMQGSKPSQSTPQGAGQQPGQMNLSGFQGTGGAPGMNRLVQGSREQSYHGAQDQEGKAAMSNQQQALFSHFNQFNQQAKQEQTSNSQQQQQPAQNHLDNLLQMTQQKPPTPTPFSQYQQPQNQTSAVQSSLQQALGSFQQKNKGLPYQAAASNGLGNSGQPPAQSLGQQPLRLPNAQQTPSMQPSGSQQMHSQNQNLLMQLGMQQNPSQQPQLDQRAQQPGGFGIQPKQESVSQQHLLAAISSMSQGGGPQDAQGAASNVPKAIQPNSLFIPGGQGQNPLQQMGTGQPKLDGMNMNGILGGASTQGGDQQRSDMLNQFAANIQPGGNQVSVPGAAGASQAAGMDPNMMQLQQNQQQPNLELNISSIPSLSKMAEFCATRGDYQQAIEYYRQLITHDPNNGASWTALGHCYLLTEDIHKAFTAYQHALYSVEDMNDPQLWYGIGILYERFESYDNAISALIGVLKMSPNFYQKSEVLYKLGTIFAKTNQIDQASKFFQNSILTSSFSVKKKVDTLIKIGLLNEEKKDFQQAKRSFEAALSLNDKNVRVHQHLAWCSFRHGNMESALRYITKAEKRSKDNAYSTYIKGRCLICLDNTQEAFECLSQAAQQLPSEAVFWTSLAVLMYNMGKINVSFEVITQATTLKHELWEVWYNLGILYETCKQPEEALIAYDMVLSIDPKQPDAQKRILAIKQCKYQEEMNDRKNPVQLQMKHPSYCIPNTLTILRNYWKHHDNKQQTTLHPVQPPQDGMPMAGTDSGPPKIPLRIETGNGEGQQTQQPPQIQLSQNALQQMQPSASNEGNQINLGNLSKPFGEQPNFDQFASNGAAAREDGENQLQQLDQDNNANRGGVNQQAVGQNSTLQQFGQQQPQLKQLDQQQQPDLQQHLGMQQEQQQNQKDHASQLMQQLQQQNNSAGAGGAQGVQQESNGKNEQDFNFKFGTQNPANNEDGGQASNQMQLPGQSSAQGNLPSQLLGAMNQASNQSLFPGQTPGQNNPLHSSAQQQQLNKPQQPSNGSEQQPSNGLDNNTNNAFNNEGVAASGQQKEPIAHELFSQFQKTYQQHQMQGGTTANPSQPDSQQPNQQPSTQQQKLQGNLQCEQQQQQQQKPSQQPTQQQQQLMQGHFSGMPGSNQQQQQQQPGSGAENQTNKVESQQQQQQFEQFIQNSKQAAAEWQQLQQQESNNQQQQQVQQVQQAPTEQQKQGGFEEQQQNIQQQFSNFAATANNNNNAGAQQQQQNQTASQQQQPTIPQQVEQDKPVQMSQSQQFAAQQQQISGTQDQNKPQGVGAGAHQQNTQQLGAWQQQMNEMQGVLPPTIGQAARPTNEANNPVGNGPKDDETEQEQSSDDNENNAVAQGPPQQVNHPNFQAMQVLNSIPMSNVNPSESFNASQKSNAQRVTPQPQQPSHEMNVENDQFRKQALAFQQQNSQQQQQLGLQQAAPLNPESNSSNNILGFTTAQNPGLPPPQQAQQLGLQQPSSEGQQNPVMGGSNNIHAGEENQNDMLGFGLGELAGKFKTATATDLVDPLQIEGLSANDQNNAPVVDQPIQPPAQQQQQQPSHVAHNPENSSPHKQFQPTNNSQQLQQHQVEHAQQQSQIQHQNSGPQQLQQQPPQGPSGSDNNLMYSQQQQNSSQAPPAQQQHEGNNQGSILGLLPPKPALGLTQPSTQQQPPQQQFPGQQQQEAPPSTYHNQSHHQQQQPVSGAVGNPAEQSQQAVFQQQQQQQQQQTTGPQGAANLGAYQQQHPQQQQPQIGQQPSGSENAAAHYNNQGQQQQFHPLLRKMPFIAQTQLGFAPMKMGGGEQPHDQRQAFQMQQQQQPDGNNPNYSEQQQQNQMPPQSNNQNDNGQNQQ